MRSLPPSSREPVLEGHQPRERRVNVKVYTRAGTVTARRPDRGQRGVDLGFPQS